jgi:anti-sigma B factor antagonist
MVENIVWRNPGGATVRETLNATPDRLLSISVTHHAGGPTVVSLTGDLDIASTGEFRSTLDALFAGGRVDVVVEISGVEFIESSGLNALVIASREAERNGGSLVVVAPSRYVSRVFDVVRIGESLEVVGSLQAASTVGGIPGAGAQS